MELISIIVIIILIIILITIIYYVFVKNNKEILQKGGYNGMKLLLSMVTKIIVDDSCEERSSWIINLNNGKRYTPTTLCKKLIEHMKHKILNSPSIMNVLINDNVSEYVIQFEIVGKPYSTLEQPQPPRQRGIFLGKIIYFQYVDDNNEHHIEHQPINEDTAIMIIDKNDIQNIVSNNIVYNNPVLIGAHGIMASGSYVQLMKYKNEFGLKAYISIHFEARNDDE